MAIDSRNKCASALGRGLRFFTDFPTPSSVAFDQAYRQHVLGAYAGILFGGPAVSQTATPSSDVSLGAWLASSAPLDPLWPMVDEAVADDDTTYIYADAGTCEIALSSVAYWVPGTVSFTVRARSA